MESGNFEPVIEQVVNAPRLIEIVMHSMYCSIELLVLESLHALSLNYFTDNAITLLPKSRVEANMCSNKGELRHRKNGRVFLWIRKVSKCGRCKR